MIIVLFLLLATGFIARKIGIIDDVSSKRLSKLIVYIGHPMMIINALMKMKYSAESTKEGLIILAAGFACLLFFALFARFAGKVVKDFDERKITEYALIFANAGFLGFPIYRSLFGDTGEFWGAFYNVSFSFLCWTLGLSIITRGEKKEKPNFRKMFLNVGTVACTIGVAVYFLTAWVDIPKSVIDYTGYLSGLCTPITTLIVGALIATRTPKQLFLDKKIYFLSFCKLIVLPLLICVITKLIGLPNDMVLFLTAAAALPSATNVTMFAELYDVAQGYAAQAVGVTSLFTVATLPAVMYVADLIVKL